MRIFLIHGMGRTPASMWILERRLRGAGHRPSLYGYFVTVSALEEIAAGFLRHIERVLAANAAKIGGGCGYAIVSHSLGGIVTRLVSPDLPAGLRCCVLLAPPNRSPAIARTLSDNTIFRLFTQDAGKKLNQAAFYEALPRLRVPALVVAGTGGPRAGWLPFRGERNDSILSVGETRLEGAPTLLVPGVHTFLMNRRDVFDAIRQFVAAHRGRSEEEAEGG